MKWSLYLGKVSGIKILIHWSFLFLIAWITVNGIREGDNVTTILYTIGFIISVFVCVTLHELGHALTAKYFHYTTRDITLLPIGGMARMDEIPENPKHELAIAFAGPAVNLVIALLLYPLIWWFGKIPTFFTVLFNTGDTFLFSLMIVNIDLAVFNLLPAFPMDGGRILRALLSMQMNRVRATVIASKIGQVIATIFFITGLFYNPILAAAGIFIFMMAQTESDYVKSKSILHDYRVSDVLIRKFYSLDAFDTIHDATLALLNVQATDFLIMEKGNVIGTLDRNRIIMALSEKGNASPVVLSMNAKVKFLSPDMPLDKVYSHLQSNSILPVMQNEKLIGIVDVNNILEFIMIKSAAEKSPTQSIIKKELATELSTA